MREYVFVNLKTKNYKKRINSVANNKINAVEEVSSNVRQKELLAVQQNAQMEEARWKKALEMKDPARLYSCFWLVIEILNHVGLDESEGAVMAQAQLMDVEHSMQQNMIKISKALSDIQGNEQGYNVYQAANGVLSPDTFLGLKTAYYNMSLDSSGNIQEQGSNFEQDVNSLETAIKQLYYSDSSDTSAPTVGDLSKIANPYVWQNGQDFDLTSFWSNLEAKFTAAGFNNPHQTGFSMVSSNPSAKASLIQQYMYYKAQSTVYSTNSDTVNAAHGDISKLVSFDPPIAGQLPSETDNNDAIIGQVLQALNLFDTTVNVQTTASGMNSLNPNGDNLLKLILEGQNSIYSQQSSGTAQAGVYAEMNMEAYRSFWSKTSAAKSAANIDPSLLGDYTNNWTQISGGGVGGADVLTGWYTQTNSVQSSIGSDTTTNSSTMQAMTANEGDEVSVGQNAIKALNQYVEALSQSQISA